MLERRVHFRDIDCASRAPQLHRGPHGVFARWAEAESYPLVRAGLPLCVHDARLAARYRLFQRRDVTEGSAFVTRADSGLPQTEALDGDIDFVHLDPPGVIRVGLGIELDASIGQYTGIPRVLPSGDRRFGEFERRVDARDAIVRIRAGRDEEHFSVGHSQSLPPSWIMVRFPPR